MEERNPLCTRAPHASLFISSSFHSLGIPQLFLLYSSLLCLPLNTLTHCLLLPPPSPITAFTCTSQSAALNTLSLISVTLAPCAFLSPLLISIIRFDRFSFLYPSDPMCIDMFLFCLPLLSPQCVCEHWESLMRVPVSGTHG